MDDSLTGVDTGETGEVIRGGGVYDFHPLQLDRVGCFKVKGEANGWALKVCASKKVLASWALGFSCRWKSPTLGEEDSNLLDTRETESGFAESESSRLMHHFKLNSTQRNSNLY